MAEMRNAYKILAGNPEGNRPLGRPRHSLEDNIKMILRKQGLRVDWINLAQNTVLWLTNVNMVMNLQVP
jgi:hypothetical protein